MRIPGKIQFLGTDYVVKFVDRITSGCPDCRGGLDEEGLVIEIKKTMPRANLERTLFHEIFHVATRMEKIPEEIATRIADSLFGLLKENNFLKEE